MEPQKIKEESKEKRVLQPVRGTRDLFGSEKRAHLQILEYAREISESYGFQEIETPIFEDTRVFHRLGETSDIVAKETYTFLDRGGDSITLRPEGTAQIVRALISNSLTQELPGKYFYTGPMFRYDRPQKGRYRQFTQVGVELFGVESHLADLEVLTFAYDLLNRLGILDKLTLEINSLGDQQSRQNYRQHLVAYFQDYRNQLSEDSQRRLQQNPLRILDSKDEADRVFIKDAPFFKDFLTPESQDFFAKVLAGLDQLDIPYHVNHRLVRGLDYYCHTAFEFTTQHLGAQGTVLAGGRYDGLVKDMGGPDIPGVGWAAGVDRLVLMAQLQLPQLKPVAVISLGEAAESTALVLTHQLREAHIYTEQIFSGNLAKRLKKANKLNASYAILIGDDELQAQQAQVKNLDSGQEEKVAFSALIAYLKPRS